MSFNFILFLMRHADFIEGWYLARTLPFRQRINSKAKTDASALSSIVFFIRA